MSFFFFILKMTAVYFHTGLASFFLGLVVTMIVMNVFKHAQPALLYLVPSCLLLPILVAFIKGDVKALIDYNCDSKIEGLLINAGSFQATQF